MATMKPVLWIVVTAVTGVACAFAGFKFGSDAAAQTTNALYAQDAVWEGISEIRLSLASLEQGDLANASRANEQHVRHALVRLGSFSKGAQHPCHEKDQATMDAVRAYASSHPDLIEAPVAPLSRAGLAVCAKADSGS